MIDPVADVLNRHFHNYTQATMVARFIRRHWDEISEAILSEDRTPRDDEYVRSIPTGNLVILLQKLSRKISYNQPRVRDLILSEAARRLNEYRQAERSRET